MQNFLFGALCTWTLLGAVTFISDTLGWRYDDRLWIFLTLPVLVVVAPVLYIWLGLFYPWRNVIKPVTRKTFEREDWRFKRCKAFRITDRFYFCTDWSASRWYKKLFFVRIRKEK